MNLSFKVGDDPGNVTRNRLIFFGGLGLPVERLALPGQVHGCTIRRVKNPAEYPETDGLVTAAPGVFLCVSVADCVPILIFDPFRRALGAVHAGWRGTAAGITGAAVRMMMSEFGSAAGGLLAWIGPAASVCCYTVGKDVASAFPPTCVSQRDGSTYVDLKQANKEALLDAGLIPGRIETSPFCTVSDSSLFHSHRRDGKRSGRMMAVIGLIA